MTISNTDSMSEFELIQQKLDEIRNLSFIGFKEILSVDEAAIFMNLSRSYIYKLCQCSEIKHFRSKGGKNIYFRKKDLSEWMLAKECMTVDEINVNAKRIANRLRKGN